MNLNLDQLTLENFRIFADPTTIKFNDLNIFTGSNNSGKSTVIKAIKLFSDGLVSSDFPSLNLITEGVNLGDYSGIINRDNPKKYFKIGFTTFIPNITEVFEVVYTFKNGTENDQQFRETASFAKMEMINSKGVVFLGIYYSYIPDVGEQDVFFDDFPSEKGDPGLMKFRMNLALLELYLPRISDQDFNHLLTQLNFIKNKDNYWCGECFSEDDYCSVDYDISKYYFADFEQELMLDSFYNLADYELKDTLFFGGTSVEEQDIYNSMLTETNYYKFIKQVFHLILDSIKSGLELFRKKNILHIVSDISQERLLPNNKQSEYVQKLYRIFDKSENILFIRESLSIFGIDGIVELKSHLNSAFEINLITDVQNILNTNIASHNEPIVIGEVEYNFPKEPYEEKLADYNSNARVNIADLGKGSANIIKLILKTAAILFSYREEKQKKERIPTDQGRQIEAVIKKTILIEEPEAFLHPNWQSRLMDFFMYCLKEYDVQFIIETHSVYLIQRLQSLVAKCDYDPDKATILYFNSKEKAEKFYRINLRKDGILRERFGSGFYDETAILTADILNAHNTN